MNSTLSRWLWPLLLLWIALGTFLCWKFLCKDCCKSNAVTGITSAASSGSNSIWNVADGTDFKASSAHFYRFLKSNSNIISPLGADLDKLNGLLSEYLKSKNQRGINVVGYYKSDEVNDNTLFENLGLARANNIKQLLVKMGIPGKQITTSSELIQEGIFSGDTLMKGAEYSFFALGDNNSKLDELKNSLKGKPLTLYFDVNRYELNLNAVQQKQLSDLMYYLDNVPDAKVEISGHTDSDGNREANLRLSRSRADFVSNYLSSKSNIAKERMEVAGYGPDKPIASNSTSEGKAQNRRVEVTLK